ncbi:hypothetical protein [Candidatus Hakubella thermalkaliphila]|uniref:Uncharacterized protein n=1 Tax=Candidatus Hakubella thermalkaliphila TaxID=2754717 RepID=A0A6V8P6I2_9ACTN|nr:hypothetical protein [Candidatus Hakubella thermalkaliphila]GFP27234.1 hypothetical protein HKBW3S33_00648 [Candidatus Hakubella thermalkaliphila]
MDGKVKARIIREAIVKNYVKILSMAVPVALLLASTVLSTRFAFWGGVSVALFAITLLVLQYLDLEYRYAIGIALFFLALCPFFLIAKQESTAEILANYAYGYLVFGLIFILMDSLRERIKRKGKLVLFRKAMLSSIFLTMFLSNYFLFPQVFPAYKAVQPFKIYTSFTMPRAYKWLKAQPQDFIIVEYPLLDERGELYPDYLHFQQIHGKKLFNLALRSEAGQLVLKSSLGEGLVQSVEGLRGREAAEMLGHYGVRYVLLHRDRPGISFYEDEREEMEGFTLVGSDDQTDIFEIDENLRKPPVYPVANIAYVSRNIELSYILESLASLEAQVSGAEEPWVYLASGDTSRDNLVLSWAEQVIVPLDVARDAVDQPTPGEGALYEDLGLTPSAMEKESRYFVSLYLLNTGSTVWPATPEENHIHASYHWLDKETGEVIIWDGVRTELPHRVIPGERVPVQVGIKTPEKPGDYILQLDLIREGVHWFSQVGVEPLSREVKVVSASPGGKEEGLEQEGESSSMVGPPTGGWEETEPEGRSYPITYTLHIPRAGDYSLYLLKPTLPEVRELRYRIDGGEWVQSSLSVLRSPQEVSPSSPEPSPSSQEVPASPQEGKYILKLLDVFLDQGDHQITFYDTRFLLDKRRYRDSDYLMFRSSSLTDTAMSGDTEIFLKKASPQEYRISVDTDRPFFLGLNEIYFPSLQAHFEDGKSIDLIANPGYPVLYLDRTGQYDVIIKFGKEATPTGQEIYIFWWISLLCIFLMVVGWTRLSASEPGGDIG